MRIPKKDNPEKLATYGTQDEEKHNTSWTPVLYESFVLISSKDMYLFLASDGQHIYLHALNARCLVKEYGSLANCPDTITANIIQMENVFMSEVSLNY